jgi:hypothetical protein
MVVQLLSNRKSGFNSSPGIQYSPLMYFFLCTTFAQFQWKTYYLILTFRMLHITSHSTSIVYAEIRLSVQHHSINQSIVYLSFLQKITPGIYTHTSHYWHVIWLYIFMYETHVLLAICDVQSWHLMTVYKRSHCTSWITPHMRRKAYRTLLCTNMYNCLINI